MPGDPLHQPVELLDAQRAEAGGEGVGGVHEGKDTPRAPKVSREMRSIGNVRYKGCVCTRERTLAGRTPTFLCLRVKSRLYFEIS